MKHMRVLVILIVLIVGTSFGQTIGKRPLPSGKVFSTNNVNAGVIWAKRARQGFNMKVWLSNQMSLGIQAWSPLNVPPDNCGNPGLGLSYPDGTCIEHLFGAGPIIGGIINGVRHVSEGYDGDNARQEFFPSVQDTSRDKIWQTNTGVEVFHPHSDGWSGYYYLHNIQVNRKGVDDDGDGKIDEDELDGLDNDGDWNPITDDVGADGLPDALEVGCKGGYDAVLNPDPSDDNYEPSSYDSCHPNPNGTFPLKDNKNIYTEKNGIPDHGEPHVDEDFGAVSDNDLYFSSTDTFHQPFVSGHFPMGIKVFAKSYAWKGDYAGAILPFEYSFINVGDYVIHDVYIGFYPDMDVGPISDPSYTNHNYTCFFSDLRTPYIGNAQDSGATPLGLAVLGTPRPLDSLKYIFQWPSGGFGFSTLDSLLYSIMSAERWGSDTLQYIRNCQSPASPTDSRFFFSFGPFTTMNPGDTLKISVAFVSGLSVSDMHDNVIKARALYGADYVLGVKEIPSVVPTNFTLMQNYPNPFNPTTQIEFQNSKTSFVSLKVFDVLGREVVTLVNEKLQPGTYTTQWNASSMPSGVYFYQLQAGEYSNVKKMLLMK